MVQSRRRHRQTSTQSTKGNTLYFSPDAQSSTIRTDTRPKIGAAWLRRRTYIGHALICFNVLGIPLSFGPYLEFYYNSTLAYDEHYPSLVQLSSLVAVQLCLLFGAAFPAGWLYQRRLQRSTIWSAGIGVVTCQGALLACNEWWQFLLICGTQGLCLGSLAVIGTLCLSTHYKSNIPLASMACINAGFLGATVYTAIAYVHLQNSHQWIYAQYATIAVLSATLFIAALLVKPNPTYKRLTIKFKSPNASVFKVNGTICFVMGFCLLFFGIFIWPTYMILLVSNAPGQTWPQGPTIALMATYGTAFVTAPLATSRYFRRGLGPVNVFIGASIIAGACYLNPAWMPYLQIAWPCTIIFGACLGPILVLAVKALSVFHFDDTMPVFLAGVLTAAGVFACLGIVITSALVDDGTDGFKTSMVVGAGAMMLGGCLMGWARWGRSGKKFKVAI